MRALRVQCTHLVTEWKKCYFGGLPPPRLVSQSRVFIGLLCKRGDAAL